PRRRALVVTGGHCSCVRSVYGGLLAPVREGGQCCVGIKSYLPLGWNPQLHFHRGPGPQCRAPAAVALHVLVRRNAHLLGGLLTPRYWHAVTLLSAHLPGVLLFFSSSMKFIDLGSRNSSVLNSTHERFLRQL